MPARSASSIHPDPPPTLGTNIRCVAAVDGPESGGDGAGMPLRMVAASTVATATTMEIAGRERLSKRTGRTIGFQIASRLPLCHAGEALSPGGPAIGCGA